MEGEEIEVRSGRAAKAVRVTQVMRGRVFVTWPFVGEFEVDLNSGELVSCQSPRSGVFQVDALTGRVVGTRASVTPDALFQLHAMQVGDRVALDCGVEAEVVDSVPSEGTIRVYVREQNLPLTAWHSRYFVRPATLDRMRQSAGCVSQAS